MAQKHFAGQLDVDLIPLNGKNSSKIRCSKNKSDSLPFSAESADKELNKQPTSTEEQPVRIEASTSLCHSSSEPEKPSSEISAESDKIVAKTEYSESAEVEDQETRPKSFVECVPKDPLGSSETSIQQRQSDPKTSPTAPAEFGRTHAEPETEQESVEESKAYAEQEKSKSELLEESSASEVPTESGKIDTKTKWFGESFDLSDLSESLEKFFAKQQLKTWNDGESTDSSKDENWLKLLELSSAASAVSTESDEACVREKDTKKNWFEESFNLFDLSESVEKFLGRQQLDTLNRGESTDSEDKNNKSFAKSIDLSDLYKTIEKRFGKQQLDTSNQGESTDSSKKESSFLKSDSGRQTYLKLPKTMESNNPIGQSIPAAQPKSDEQIGDPSTKHRRCSLNVECNGKKRSLLLADSEEVEELVHVHPPVHALVGLGEGGQSHKDDGHSANILKKNDVLTSLNAVLTSLNAVYEGKLLEDMEQVTAVEELLIGAMDLVRGAMDLVTEESETRM